MFNLQKLGYDPYNMFNVNEIKTSSLITNKNNYTIEVLVPGVIKSNLKLKVDDNRLVLSYKADESNSSLFSSNSFTRTFKVPDLADLTKVEAKYIAGIVKITIPKLATKKIKEEIIEIK